MRSRVRWKWGGVVRVAACGLLVGCASKTVYLEGHRTFPRNPRFTIVPREYSPEELAKAGLRTDGVYMVDRWHPPEKDTLEKEALRREGIREGSGYYRFWANGRTLVRTARVEPEEFTAEHADSFERAVLGYYQILPDGSIEVEDYAYYGGEGDYIYWKARLQIRGDEIWSGWGGAKHKGEPVYLIYKFRPVPGMKAEPDW